MSARIAADLAEAGCPYRVVLCSHQPLLRYQGRYYAQYKNFTDFLLALAEMGPEYHLVLPCRDTQQDPGAWATMVVLPVERCSFMVPHTGHLQAPLRNFLNAVAIRHRIGTAVEGRVPLLYGGPGPNTLLFWLSWLSPRATHFAFFIRGDTIRTLRLMYRGSWRGPLAAGLTRLIRRRIRRLTACGRARVFPFGEALCAQYPGPPGSVRAISPLIEARLLRSPPREPSRAGPLRVLYVGRLSPEKNVLALVEACGRAIEGGLALRLTLVGAGPLEGAVRERIGTLGLSGQVTLKGHLPYGDELIAQYDQHDLLCLPSLTEGTPTVVAEAFARRLPVLATPVGSLPLHFPAEVRFLPGFEAADIAAGLEWCTAHRDTLAAMVEQARRGLGRFLLEDNARLVHEALVEMMRAPQPGSKRAS